MSASQAGLLSVLASPVTVQRALPQDGQSRDSGGWQQAFQVASRGDEGAPGVEEAARMLALGNLAMSPVPVAPQPLAASSAASGGEPTRAIQSASRPATPSASVRATPNASPLPSAHPAGGLAAVGEVRDADAAAQPTPHGAVAGPDGQRRGHASSDHGGGPRPVDAIALPVGGAAPAPMEEAAALRAVASYAAAMSTSAPSDGAADFSLFARSSSLPVRVHVQWRGRVADVWIGLHRQAFDQLPDIRAGVEHWVHSRGGVLGHVVCNGEALARVAPSVSFLGAL